MAHNIPQQQQSHYNVGSSMVSASSLIPMQVAEQRSDSTVYRDIGETGTTVTVVSSAPHTTQDFVTTVDGRQVRQVETRQTLTPTISPTVSSGFTLVKEEQLQPTVSTRAYETFRRSPSSLHPESRIVSVGKTGPFVTPSGCIIDTETNTVSYQGQVTPIHNTGGGPTPSFSGIRSAYPTSGISYAANQPSTSIYGGGSAYGGGSVYGGGSLYGGGSMHSSMQGPLLYRSNSNLNAVTYNQTAGAYAPTSSVYTTQTGGVPYASGASYYAQQQAPPMASMILPTITRQGSGTGQWFSPTAQMKSASVYIPPTRAGPVSGSGSYRSNMPTANNSYRQASIPRTNFDSAAASQNYGSTYSAKSGMSMSHM